MVLRWRFAAAFKFDLARPPANSAEHLQMMYRTPNVGAHEIREKSISQKIIIPSAVRFHPDGIIAPLHLTRCALQQSGPG